MNVVIDFNGDLPDDTRPVGIDVATREFLRAFFRFADQSTFATLAPNSSAFATFRDLAGEENISAQRCTAIAGIDDPALAEAGLLMRYDPAISQYAWRRRRHGQKRFSLVGLAHASASNAVREAIGALATAPLQSWDALICPSHSIKQAIGTILEGWQNYFEERFGQAAPSPLQLPIIPLGVDTVRFDKITAPERRIESRARLGLADNAVAILYVGRLNYVAKANPMPLLLAVEDVATRSAVPIHLLFNGYFNDEDNEQAFAAAVAALCTKAKVTVIHHGDASFPQGLWAAADIFCSPTDNIQESFGLTPIEAMAAGLPSVVSDWDGYRETVRDRVDGFVIPTLAPAPGSGAQLAYDYFAGRASYGDYLGATSQSTAIDTEALSRALFTLATNADLRRDMSMSARRRARDSFEWSRVIRGYTALWADLSERRASTAEVAPLRDGAAFHPSHPDPFTMFASFATLPIDPDGLVELTGLGWDQALRRIRLKIGLIVPQTLIELEELPLVIGQLESVKNASVRELAQMLGIADGSKLTRTVGWLVKLGICRYRAPPAPE